MVEGEIINIKVDLIKAALNARKKAYAPYSRFKVGAALLASDGRVYTGCNIESASYGLSMCAERVAMFKAVSSGVHKFRTIAIVTGARKITTPCGACRQALSEFNPSIEILLANTSGKNQKTRLSKLLPRAFRLKK